jgi:hypothetical protein
MSQRPLRMSQGPPHMSQGPPHMSQGPPHMSQGPPRMSQGPPHMSQGRHRSRPRVKLDMVPYVMSSNSINSRIHPKEQNGGNPMDTRLIKLERDIEKIKRSLKKRSRKSRSRSRSKRHMTSKQHGSSRNSLKRRLKQIY